MIPKLLSLNKQATLIKKQLEEDMKSIEPKNKSKFGKDKDDSSDFSGSEKSVEPQPVPKPAVKPQTKLPPLKLTNNKLPKAVTSPKTKNWVSKMPPMIGHNIRQDLKGLPDFDEDKFCLYSVFREKILDKILKEELKEVAAL